MFIGYLSITILSCFVFTPDRAEASNGSDHYSSIPVASVPASFPVNFGTIHLAGNMHSSRLIYFRSAIPYDIHSMQAIDTMTGREEDVTTYPVFMPGPKSELLFHYRYGKSGSGYEIFNIWDAERMQWKRLLDKPLTDGRVQMNAYMQGPVSGPDGYYHIIWV